MLESLFSFEALDKRPYLIIIWSIIIGSVAIILSLPLPYYRIFGLAGNIVDIRGLLAIIFTIVPASYFMTNFIKREEEDQEEMIIKKYQSGIWERHGKHIFIFLLYFFSLTLTFSLWNFFLPDTFFQIQKLELVRIGSENAAILSGNLTAEANFFMFLFNNLRLTMFSFVVGLLFGAGAIFILTWNSSLLSTKIAIKAKILTGIPLATSSFISHGVFEIGGYVLAGLAGSIISAAILRSHHKRGVMRRIILDSVYILALAVIFIFLGAWIEAFL